MTTASQEPAIKPPSPAARKTPMQWFTNGCVHYVERLMPDPYLFAVILTLLVVGLIFLLVPDANACLLYTSPSPRDGLLSRMPSSA